MEVIAGLSYELYEYLQTFSKLFFCFKASIANDSWHLSKLHHCSNVEAIFFMTNVDMCFVKIKSGILFNSTYITLTHVTSYNS